MGIKTAGKTFEQLASELGSTYSPPVAKLPPEKWYTPAETAALMRAKLKETFGSRVKARVKTDVYAGGASIRVYWTGPEELKEEVRIVTEGFEAGTFNGMIDLYEYRRNELFGVPVHYGAGYVFTYYEGE